MKEQWFKKCYRRLLIDSHIPDWDDRFLSKFDPKNVVDMYSLANATSVMLYSCCHVGNCYWPTKVGHMHKALKGRDVFGEIINMCHQRGIKMIVYYSVIFNRWVYENYPDWRMINASGKPYGENNRHGLSCVNSPYKDFVLKQMEEICTNYDFEGVFYDMTFWPGICYCSYCQKRFISEVGKELPKVIDWYDPVWSNFQRKREKWMIEFASAITNQVKRFKPNATVNHQTSTLLWDWGVATSLDLVDYCDYMGGDFYSPNLSDMSFVSKFFMNLTLNKPPEFHTSRCYNLSDHTTIKPKELMRNQVLFILANNSAFSFIDAIDPEGTLNKKVYQMVGELYEEAQKYEPYLGGELLKDVGLYYSLESKIDFSHNGKKVDDPHLVTNHLHGKAITNSCKSILNAHIPFDILTRKRLKDLSSYQVIILPNILVMSKEEADAIRDYVRNGGCVYASKYTSLYSRETLKQDDFMLADLFGVSYLGETKEEVTYMAPKGKGEDLFMGYSAKYPLINFGSQLKLKLNKKAEVLSTLTLPYTDPKDPNRYSSVHSNPPGIPTDYPAVVLNQYGKGRVIYVAGDLEAMEYEPHRQIFTNLIKSLSPKPFLFEAEAPKSVEVSIFHQKENERYLINVVNFQNELPNIPVEGIVLRVRLDGKRPERLISLPENKEIPYEIKGDCLELTVPKLETFLMMALDYK